ncbi:MAG: ABC transporter ATP-binding protein [Alphaproteobacteria bacterium]|nr:ABC transporter ATP-binding protein [Alphaproteobacteria bacterium]MDE2336681.1 ABC transporter ATP-binding protein [Alphaproteobacteria bacterium]
MPPILKLDHVDLHLKSEAGLVHILKDISLELPGAKTVGIMGPSGSGKTTLLMVLGGLEKPTAGTVEVAGTALNGMDEDALATFRRDHIGIVFQNFHLIPTMTALENVAIPLEFAGAENAFGKAEEALDAVGLKARVKHYPGQLSGGEQQRVAIARAFVARPRLILADEPTGNLDAETGQKVMRLMFDMTKKHGTTLILVTHDERLAESCDMQVRLRDGMVLQ